MLGKRVRQHQMDSASPGAGGEKPKKPRFSAARVVPVLVLIVGFGLAVAFDLHHYLSFDALRENRLWLLQQVEQHAVVASLVFVLAYILVVAFSVPGGSFMTIAGGFLFGQWLGTAFVLFAASVGASIIFIAAKTALGSALHDRAGPWLQKMEAGFQENAFNYLLVLRLIPLFPFFVVNLVPAFLGMRLAPYFLATALGIVPGTFVYATVGAGLGSIFDSGESFTTQGILTPEIITALIGLAVLSLLPVIYKKVKARRG